LPVVIIVTMVRRNVITMTTTTVMTHKTQKIKAKNECEKENENKDHSHDNENLNELTRVNEAQNLKDVEQVDVFESNDTLV
jgi:hypothetical protein